jgi:CO/xanthine dehydrogenase FAD-binding subunit
MSEVFSPTTLQSALERLREDPTLTPLAGCTDWMVRGAVERLEQVGVLDLLRIEELRGIRELGEGEELCGAPGSAPSAAPGALSAPKSTTAAATGFKGLRIGATTSFSQIREHPLVREHYPILAEAASQIGGRQIQNRATVGGNMVNASPAGDSLPVLLAFNAEVEIAGLKGMRRVAYDSFYTGYRTTVLQPGELLSAVLLPPVPSYQRFKKVGTRRAQAISKVVLALCAQSGPHPNAEDDGERWSQVRIAAGSVAPTPVRLRAAEAVCEGAPVGIDTALQAAQAARAEVTPIDDIRSTAHYRRFALGRVLRRMLRG